MLCPLLSSKRALEAVPVYVSEGNPATEDRSPAPSLGLRSWADMIEESPTLWAPGRLGPLGRLWCVVLFITL